MNKMPSGSRTMRASGLRSQQIARVKKSGASRSSLSNASSSFAAPSRGACCRRVFPTRG
jgi:hypothetical protein